MPNYFSLTNKSTGKTERFADIDDKLCAHLGVEADEHLYFRDWYNGMSQYFAMGWSFERIRDEAFAAAITAGDDDLKAMLDWFDENYLVSAGYMPNI